VYPIELSGGKSSGRVTSEAKARVFIDAVAARLKPRVRIVPSLRDSVTFSHPTQDSASLRPGLTALPPLRGSFFVSHTPPPRIKLSSHADSESVPFEEPIKASLRVSARTDELLHHPRQHFSRLAQHHGVKKRTIRRFLRANVNGSCPIHPRHAHETGGRFDYA